MELADFGSEQKDRAIRFIIGRLRAVSKAPAALQKA